MELTTARSNQWTAWARDSAEIHTSNLVSAEVETVGIEPTQRSRREERLSDLPSPAW
jgi:hypothetical protein